MSSVCRKMDFLGQARLLDYPGQVGGFDAAVTHRARDAEAGGFRARSRFREKTGDDLAEFVVLAAGIDPLGDQLQVPVAGLKVRQPGIGSTNIAGQDHLSRFLQRRPSRSRSSSASFGPQVPEA